MMKELFDRLSGETPKFFKKLRAICITIGSLSTVIVTSGLAIPDTYLFILGQTGILCGIVGAFVASLPLEDTSVLDK